MQLEGPALGVALGLGASCSWALANVFIHKVSRVAGDVVPLLWGQIIGGSVLLPALWFFPPPGGWQLSGTGLGWLALAGVSSAFAYIGLFRSFSLGPISILSPIIAAWALVSAGMGVLLFGESLPPLRALGGLMVIGGAMALASRGGAQDQAQGADAWHGPRWKAIGAAVVSALGFGLMVGSLGPVAQQLGPVGGILAVWSVQWVVLMPVALRRTGGRLLAPRAVLPSIALLGVAEASGFLLVEIGTMTAPLAVVAPASSTAALVTVVLGRVWLGEAAGWDRVLLAGVVVAGIALLAVG